MRQLRLGGLRGGRAGGVRGGRAACVAPGPNDAPKVIAEPTATENPVTAASSAPASAATADPTPAKPTARPTTSVFSVVNDMGTP